ncbi:hypothetical protein QUF72_09510 [Desulfobacterales bacterium HSG2]|nr:hypothetical protein [Desulfobacterales bacterium HSG2]
MAGYDLETEWLELPEGTLLEPGDVLKITGSVEGKAETYYPYGRHETVRSRDKL